MSPSPSCASVMRVYNLADVDPVPVLVSGAGCQVGVLSLFERSSRLQRVVGFEKVVTADGRGGAGVGGAGVDSRVGCGTGVREQRAGTLRRVDAARSERSERKGGGELHHSDLVWWRQLGALQAPLPTMWRDQAAHRSVLAIRASAGRARYTASSEEAPRDQPTYLAAPVLTSLPKASLHRRQQSRRRFASMG